MIHQFTNNGIAVVMDVNSGPVHVADPAFYRAVQVMEPLVEELKRSEPLPEVTKEAVRKELGGEFPAEEIEEVIETMQTLIGDEGLLIKDSYQTSVRDFKAGKTVVRAPCLHTVHGCNPARRYCFAEEGEYHGRRALMSSEVGKKALGFLVANPGTRRNLEIDLFDGEPTMNWKIVKQLVEYERSLEKAHGKKFRLMLTTNGVLPSDGITMFCNRGMSSVALSPDSREEVNDRVCPTRGGQGSYDIIVPKFQCFAAERDEKHKDYHIHGTFTHSNLEFSEDVLHPTDPGFKKMGMESVIAGPAEPYAIREEDLPIVLERCDKLTAEYVKRRREGKGSVSFHFQIDLKQGPCVTKHLSGCGSGAKYLAVTPWSGFYPCHQFVGKEEFLLGNADTGIRRSGICDELKSCDVYTRPKCEDCGVRFYCSGGCTVDSQNSHHNLTDAYEVGCAIQERRIEYAIMIKIVEMLDAAAAEEARVIRQFKEDS